MRDKTEPSNLTSTFVVLDPKFDAATVSVSDSVYAEIDAQYNDFKGHLLVSSHYFDDDWPTWEVHPHGDEIVCLVSGDVELVLRNRDVNESVRLTAPGAFVVVPRNTWHTAKIHSQAQMIFVTPGEATVNRENPPS